MRLPILLILTGTLLGACSFTYETTSSEPLFGRSSDSDDTSSLVLPTAEFVAEMAAGAITVDQPS